MNVIGGPIQRVDNPVVAIMPNWLRLRYPRLLLFTDEQKSPGILWLDDRELSLQRPNRPR